MKTILMKTLKVIGAVLVIWVGCVLVGTSIAAVNLL